MQHSFDIEIAAEYGIVEAILLNNFAFWITKNKANNKHMHDGRYWTYNSVKAYAELFPYLSEKQVRRAINKLVEQELLVTGNFNKLCWDRTLWYALTDKAMMLLRIDLRPKESYETDQKGKWICPKGQMEMTEKANRNAPEGEPIPDINTDVNTDVSSSSSKEASAIEAEENTTAAAAKDAIVFWMNNTGQFGEVIRSDIADLTDKYGAEFVKEAMREAIRSNVRNIKYVTAIAERMASGQEKPSKASTGNSWNEAFEKLFGGEEDVGDHT